MSEQPAVHLPAWLKPMNRLIMAMNWLGIEFGTFHVLTVPGRKTGRLISTPVSPFMVEGERYVLSLPGIAWVRNARAVGWGIVARGRRQEGVYLAEVSPADRPRIARHFPLQVPHGVRFFQLPADPAAFEAAAGRFVLFRLEPVSSRASWQRASRAFSPRDGGAARPRTPGSSARSR